MPKIRAMLGWRWYFLLVWLSCQATGGIVWQPVMDYPLSFPKDHGEKRATINPFENFTHLGTDFGLMGPGEDRVESKGGPVKVKAGAEWTGFWHSLAGLALDDRHMDLTDVTSLLGPPSTRSPVRAVTLNIRGTGDVRLELADLERKPVWERKIPLNPGLQPRLRYELQPAELGRVKFINLIVEPGAEVEITSLGFEVERPDVPLEEWMFRVSLGKLRRCHDAGSGLTRDRSHVPAGVFDSVASTGMHALASAAAAAEGLLDREKVSEEIRHTTAVVLSLPRASGFLPHFTFRREDGSPWIHPGTEYSTVDTAIALVSLRLAAAILNLVDVSDALDAGINGLDFDGVTDKEGWVSHGLAEDGKTPLVGKWRDWGGETALVLALEAMIENRMPQARMEATGNVFRGVAFIMEIQSLFFPDFDRKDPDLVVGSVWPKQRQELLQRQISYMKEQWPDSPATKAGIFGLSAGEAGMPGTGYTANGPDVPGIRWLHPHAMVMGLALSGGNSFGPGVERLERAGLLFPQGLPENVEISLILHNPMQGSLNAAFEAISSYHGWRRGKPGANVIDQACMTDALMRKGAERFFKPTNAGK
jgi:hypothetical protein